MFQFDENLDYDKDLELEVSKAKIADLYLNNCLLAKENKQNIRIADAIGISDNLTIGNYKDNIVDYLDLLFFYNRIPEVFLEGKKVKSFKSELFKFGPDSRLGFYNVDNVNLIKIENSNSIEIENCDNLKEVETTTLLFKSTYNRKIKKIKVNLNNDDFYQIISNKKIHIFSDKALRYLELQNSYKLDDLELAYLKDLNIISDIKMYNKISLKNLNLINIKSLVNNTESINTLNLDSVHFSDLSDLYDLVNKSKTILVRGTLYTPKLFLSKYGTTKKAQFVF